MHSAYAGAVRAEGGPEDALRCTGPQRRNVCQVVRMMRMVRMVRMVQALRAAQYWFS